MILCYMLYSKTFSCRLNVVRVISFHLLSIGCANSSNSASERDLGTCKKEVCSYETGKPVYSLRDCHIVKSTLSTMFLDLPVLVNLNVNPKTRQLHFCNNLVEMMILLDKVWNNFHAFWTFKGHNYCLDKEYYNDQSVITMIKDGKIMDRVCHHNSIRGMNPDQDIWMLLGYMC